MLKAPGPSGGMADAVDSKSTLGNEVGVQVPSRAMLMYNPNHKSKAIRFGKGFGFLLFLLIFVYNENKEVRHESYDRNNGTAKLYNYS